jgi:RNA polymerase sigma factor (sigma-70 family)
MTAPRYMKITLGELVAARGARSPRSWRGGQNRDRRDDQSPRADAPPCAGPKELLIRTALPKARYLAGKYSRYGGVDFDDLFQEGCLAIVLAVDHYDAALSSFAAFASVCIRHAVTRYIYDHRTVVRLPLWQQNAKARREGKAGRVRCHSLDAPLLADDSSVTWLDTLSAPSPSEHNEFNSNRRLLAELLHAIDVLPPRAREVLRARYFNERGLTRIAHGLGVSYERARQLEAEALDLLRRILAVRALDDRIGPARERRTSWVIDTVLAAQNRVGGPVTSPQALRVATQALIGNPLLPRPVVNDARAFTKLARVIVRLGPDARGRVLQAVVIDRMGRSRWWVAEPGPTNAADPAPEWKSTGCALE